ncbi:MAG: hypothetical protein H6732_02870 [Alphaproteobacteria bacterium]|nr:hypothetical protein [Alphaproteobacteria bacterium]
MQDLPFHPAGTPSLLAFVAVVGLVVACGVGAAVFVRAPALRRPAALRAGTIAGVWLALTAALPAAGLVGIAPPTMAAFLLLCLGSALALGLSAEGGRWARGVPLAALVGFQAFRLPLELVLHAWAEEGTVPVHMTWSGQNLDVVTGLVSVVAAVWLWRWPGHGVAWAANLVGLALLANVVRVALLSAPLPLPWSFGADPPLLLALHAPYAWIVSVCVGGALAGHVITTRRLLGSGAEAAGPPPTTGTT